MANKPISGLPQDSTLSGNENIVTEENGTNFKVLLSTVRDWIVNNLTFVDSVNAGSNVEVNNSDPKNPIVSAFPTTTAGILSRTYFTGDTETLAAGTFYKSNRNGKGTISTATQNVTVNDNQKAYFSQDSISEPYPIDTTIYGGAYSGILNGFVSSNGGEQRFTIEIYKTDLDGNPIPSGITGAPIGDLGETVIAIAQSGLIDLQSGNESQFAVTAQLDSDLTLLTTNRIRYHVSAEKVGTTGGSIDISTSYGNTHVAHLDIPIQSLTSTTINDDPIKFPSLATQYDINRSLDKTIKEFTEIFSGATISTNANKSFIYCNFSSDDNVIITDNSLDIGEIAYFFQGNTGIVTLVPDSGVTITPNASGNLVSIGQNDTIGLLKLGVNDYQMI